MTDPFRSGAFAPLLTDLPLTPCDIVDGTLPDIAGRYLRNGPNSPVEPAGPYVYPIDGDGMLHEITFDGAGGVHYRRSWVRTPMLDAELTAGRALWGTVMMGLQPLPGAPVSGRKDIPDVNVIEHGGRLLALAERTLSYNVDAATLQTLGPDDFDGQYPAGATAHPKRDPSTGNLVVFAYEFTAPYLSWCEIDASGATLRSRTAIEGLDFPAMIHDCAITSTHVVIPVYPLVFDPLRKVTAEGPPLQWQETRGTRIAVIDRADGKVTWFEGPPRWSWHTVNARSSDEVVILDVVSYDCFAMDDRLGNLERMTLDLCTGAFAIETIADRVGEFPRIDDRRIGRDYDLVASATNDGPARAPGTFDTIAVTDPLTGATDTWTEAAQPLGEPIHIPGIDEHWAVLTAAPEGERSHLLIFGSTDVANGPVTRIALPDRVPAGLHGTWIPE